MRISISGCFEEKSRYQDPVLDDERLVHSGMKTEIEKEEGSAEGEDGVAEEKRSKHVSRAMTRRRCRESFK